jgi:hypothetical protein
MKNLIQHILILLLICAVGYNKLTAQSSVFNVNYNYEGNVYYNETWISVDGYYNNESFAKLYNKQELLCVIGSTYNNYLLFNDVDLEIDLIVNCYDYSGDLKQSNFYDFRYSEGLTDYVILNNNYYCGTVINADSTYWTGLILKTDSNNNYVWHKEYNFFDEDNRFMRIFSNSVKDKLIVFSHVRNSQNLTPNYNLLISIMDTSGNMLQNYIIEDSTSIYECREVYLIDDSTFIISGRKRLLSNNRTQTFLMKYSLSEGVLWEENYYFNPQANNFLSNYSSFVKKDDDLYLVGQNVVAGSNSFPDEAGFLLKTDLEGNQVWFKNYRRGSDFYSEFFKGIQSHPDGTLIIAGGTRDYSDLSDVSAPRGWLLKMDTAGNVIWERVLSRYHAHFWDDYVNDVIITNDGGIAIAGYVIHNFIRDENGIFHRNDAWLCKTDSCGFTVGDVPEPMILVASSENLTINLQNLSENYCTATLSWGDGSADEHIYAYSEPIYGYSPNLAHTYTEPGTYEICIEALAGEEFRSYCTEVTVMPNSLTSVTEQNTGFRLFPNPSSSYVVVEMVEVTSTGSVAEVAELVEATCKAYNLNGQLVATFPLLNQVQQKLDISHLSPGVYIMNLEKSGEYIGSQKLVVVR